MQNHFAQADKGRLYPKAISFALGHSFRKCFKHVGRKKRFDAGKLTLIKSHEDHFIGAARALQKCANRKAGLCLFHG